MSGEMVDWDALPARTTELLATEAVVALAENYKRVRVDGC